MLIHVEGPLSHINNSLNWIIRPLSTALAIDSLAYGSLLNMQ